MCGISGGSNDYTVILLLHIHCILCWDKQHDVLSALNKAGFYTLPLP